MGRFASSEKQSARVIDAIRAVGDSMSSDLKETARGGLASTPTARIIVKELIRKNQFHSEN